MRMQREGAGVALPAIQRLGQAPLEARRVASLRQRNPHGRKPRCSCCYVTMPPGKTSCFRHAHTSAPHHPSISKER